MPKTTTYDLAHGWFADWTQADDGADENLVIRHDGDCELIALEPDEIARLREIMRDPAAPGLNAANDGIVVGARVKLRDDFENYPIVTVPAGTTGTVTELLDEGTMVKLDKHNPDLDEWDNCLMVWMHPTDNGDRKLSLIKDEG